VPPVAGFVSKWYLLNGAMGIHNMTLVVVLLTSTILNAGYFAPITIRAFFQGERPKWSWANIKEAPMTMVVPLVLASLISVAIGIFPQFFVGLIGRIIP